MFPEKRQALAQWVNRLTRILGYNPNDVMKAKRNGYQGKGDARRLDGAETYRERKARLKVAGRDLNAERGAARAAKVAASRPPRASGSEASANLTAMRRRVAFPA